MSTEKKERLNHITETVSQLDEESLILVQVAANILLAKDKQLMSSKNSKADMVVV